MKIQWHHPLQPAGKLILAADVGGTNSNIAIVQKTPARFNIVLECVFPTQSILNFIDPVKETLKIFAEKHPDAKPVCFCVSAAGPVNNGRCQLTNAKWAIDGGALQSALNIPCTVINDFSAISWGIPLLDTTDPSRIMVLPHSDGSTPSPTGTVKAVVGAGTGLGFGYMFEEHKRLHVFASEGGHADFCAFDDESSALRDYMRAKLGQNPGIEVFVSGQGISNIFYFMKDVQKIPMTGILAEIEAAADTDKPKLISVNSVNEPVCARILKLFVACYARTASNAAVTFLPSGGLYLAGGIVTKDHRFFVEDGLFMKHFEMNYNKNIRPLLKTIPVYIIKDYSVSLYGAANAADQMEG
jgi:glucokinase